MLKLNDEQRDAFARAVSEVPESLEAEVRAIYDAFEQERAIRQPKCDRSGACCRFEEHGHRLFVTTVEVASFRPRVDPAAGWDGTGCPYQINGLCAAHDVRPFGCRVYFCDRSSDDWQQQQYERFHAALRELHDRHGVPYAYVEWREALSAVGLSRAAVRTESEAVAPRRLALTVRPDRR